MVIRISDEFRRVLDWSDDWLINDEDEETRKAKILAAVGRRRELLRRSAGERTTFLSRVLVQNKRERDALIEKYAHAYLLDLDLEAQVSSTDDLAELLNLIHDPTKEPRASDWSNKSQHQHRRFGALSLFDWTCLIGGMELTDSQKSASEDIKRLVAKFTDELFKDEVRTVVVERFHDSNRSYRVNGIAVYDPDDPSYRIDGIPVELPARDPRFIREDKQRCRILPNGSLVGFHHRTKTLFDAYQKILIRCHDKRNGKLPEDADSFRVRDRCGFKFLVPSQRHVAPWIHELKEFIEHLGGQCKDDALDPQNLRRSAFYKTTKLWIEWDDREYEAQVMTFEDYYSSRFASDEENHELYKLRACLDVFFPLFFPESLYGIKWGHADVQKYLHEQKVPQLTSRMDVPRP